ncbi:MAG: acyl-CoA thioesterase [Ignavibacteriae bacterium]|nr:acyl-CoA thioesterase [Ignavibacteriota bacterium]MCB9206783.1 acyl-CoA thioesterase [Ignavibacteriales bacterium]MCB9210209.1 acyl-CoA thioesterase [Ignavibacteriales bacterium]MCB9218406.1 acyl-CoA thioesterase [Ignavibacteriales bacterium]MCB9259588.1 acyl-CoA thioesterase [Ignavibacteriales bacterium]
MIKENFTQKITEVVKFHEVDMLGVCNNAVYLNYFEDARLKYLQTLSAKYNFTQFLVDDSFVIMARNEIDYLSPSFLDDELTVYTKIEKVSNSSFSFEHFIVREIDSVEIARGRGVLVHINKETKKSMKLPDEFHQAVLDFERG